jgi:polysaccharide export outer membrane protein
MKTINRFLVLLMLGTTMLSSSVGMFAQTPATNANKTRQRFATKTEVPADENAQDPNAKTEKPVKNEIQAKDDGEPTAASVKNLESASLDDSAEVKPTEVIKVADGRRAADKKPSDLPEDTVANRHEQVSEEAAVVPYYNNFFNTYRLGPEDVVSVSVFGQDRYSRSGITIPPSGRISLALIPGGVFVNGKTVDEVADAITKRYDEYIIDPQVSVSLDKASSYRYSVIGDVAQPGIRLMTHRMTVAEAIGEAGGVLSTGNRSKIIVLRRQADGKLNPIAVNLTAIYQGKAPDITYLVPGDQVIVPGNKMKSIQKIMSFFPILSFARIFTAGLL